LARFNFSRFLQAGAFLCASLATPALAADVNGTASYIVSLSGLNIATINVDLTDDGKRYALDLKANVSGLGQLVASGSATASSAGLSSGRSLVSQKFDLSTKANRETFSVDVSYARGNVASFKVEPPLVNNIDRVPIERSHLTGVNDMLASFVVKGGALDKSLCGRKMAIFTGVERFNVAMSYAKDDVATSARTGYQGPVVLCNIRYTPVSGHFTTSEMTSFLAESDRILIWYAPMGDTGFHVPYRILLTTSVGDLSMVLTKLTY
jgi:hypothetical protein